MGWQGGSVTPGNITTMQHQTSRNPARPSARRMPWWGESTFDVNCHHRTVMVLLLVLLLLLLLLESCFKHEPKVDR